MAAEQAGNSKVDVVDDDGEDVTPEEIDALINDFEITTANLKRQKRKFDKIERELAEINVKEPELRRTIKSLKKKEKEMKAKFEKILKDLEAIKAERRKIDLKLKMHRVKSSFYKDAIENFERKIPDFMCVDESSKNRDIDKEITTLKAELDALQRYHDDVPVPMSTSRSGIDESIRKHIQANPSDKMVNLMKSIHTLEMNLQMKRRELMMMEQSPTPM